MYPREADVLSRRSVLRLFIGSTALGALSWGTATRLLAEEPYRGRRVADPEFTPEGVVVGYSCLYEDGEPKVDGEVLKRLAILRDQGHLVASGTKSVDAAVATVREQVDQLYRLDPETFRPFAGTGRYASDMGRIADTLGNSILAGALGGIGVAFSSYGGAVTTAALGNVATEYLSPTLRAMFAQQLSVPMYQKQALATGAYLASDAFRLTAYPPVFKLADECYKAGLTPLDPTRTPKEAAKRLPKWLRAAAEGTVAVSGVSGKDAANALRSASLDGAKAADKELADLAAALVEQREVAARQAEAEAAYRQVAYVAAEMQGIGVLADALAGSVLGSEVGRTIGTFARSTAEIALAIATPGIGPIALAGRISGAVLSILGSGTSDLNSLLLSSIASFHDKLEIVSNRLGVVEAMQRKTLADLSTALKLIAENGTRMQQLRSSLDAFMARAAETAATDARDAYDSSAQHLGDMLTNNPPEKIAGSETLLAGYELAVSACVSLALKTAARAEYAANYSEDPTEAAWVEHIRVSGRADRLVGALPDLLTAMEAPQSTSFSGSQKPVSPITWAEGSTAFMSARIAVLRHKRPADAENLEALWKAGLYTRRLIDAATSPSALERLRRRVRVAAGLPAEDGPVDRSTLRENTLAGALFTEAQATDDSIVRRRLKIETRTTAPVGNLFSSGFSWVGTQLTPGGLLLVSRFEPDFFGELLSQGVLKSVDCMSGLPTHVTSCFYEVASGPQQGMRLVPERVWMGAKEAAPALMGNYYPPRSTSSFPSYYAPEHVQRAAQALALERVDRAKFIAAISAEGSPFGSQVAKRLGLANSFAYWGYWPSMSNLVASLLSWRCAQDEGHSAHLSGATSKTPKERPDNSRLDNVGGPYTVAGAAQGVIALLDKHLSASGHWPTEMVRILGLAIDDSFDRLIALSSSLPSEKSLPALDSTLRSIAGFYHSTTGKALAT